MTKQESAKFAELEAQIAALSTKIEAMAAAKSTAKPAVRAAWVNPNRPHVPSVSEIIEWRRGWAKAHPGFTTADVTAAEAAFKVQWHADHPVAA